MRGETTSLNANKQKVSKSVYISVFIHLKCRVMHKISKLLLSATAVLSATAPAAAQRWVKMPDDATPIICISETINEAPDVVEIFQNSQSNYHHDPRAPRFVLVDQEGRWGLGIGGYLQTKIEYDFDKAVDNVDFFPSAIQRGGAPSSQYRMDMTNSTLFSKSSSVSPRIPAIISTPINAKGKYFLIVTTFSAKSAVS